MRTTYGPPTRATALALLGLTLPTVGACSSAPCDTAPLAGGVGVTAVDGVTDAQGRADVTAVICLGDTCRTASLAGEPGKKGTLVAGFADLPLTSGQATTVRVSLQRAGATTAGPYDVEIHPVGGAPTSDASDGGASGCAPATSYVGSVVVDALGAHEGTAPQAPGRT